MVFSKQEYWSGVPLPSPHCVYIDIYIHNILIGKDPGAGKDQKQEKGMTEDEMVGWHHRLYGHELEQASGVGDRQGSSAYQVFLLLFFFFLAYKVL